jgi:hypothetical protein
VWLGFPEGLLWGGLRSSRPASTTSSGKGTAPRTPMLQAIAQVLDLFCWIAFPISFAAAPLLVVNWMRYTGSAKLGGKPTRPFPIWSVCLFVLPIMTVVAMGSGICAIARSEFLSYLDSSMDVDVSVDGQNLANSRPAMIALRSTHAMVAHHSHPTKSINLKIISQSGDLSISLGRDSGNPREYWVFYPKYGFTSTNEIGRITTSVFDKY